MFYKDKDFFKMTQLTFSLALYLRLPAQMPLDRVPDPFPHCDGEVAEFPVVAGEDLDGKGLSQWRGFPVFI